MYFTRISQILSLPHALARYNTRFDSRFQLRHIRVLLVLRIFNYPLNRSEILRILEKRSLTMNYSQLSEVLELLQKEQMTSLFKKRGIKVYQLGPAGIQFLTTLERWIRKMRFDKLEPIY